MTYERWDQYRSASSPSSASVELVYRVPSSDMKRPWGLWLICFYLSRLPACYKSLCLGSPGFIFRVFLDNLPTVANVSCLPASNPGKEILPGDTSKTSGTWSSHKAVSPLSAVGTLFWRHPEQSDSKTGHGSQWARNRESLRWRGPTAI